MKKVSKFKMFLAKTRGWIFRVITGIWNFITDLAVPVLGVVSVILVIVPGVPLKVVSAVKGLEELCSHLGSKKEDIENEMNKYK